ncbi:unnamed protein product [Urochloa humidicola]
MVQDGRAPAREAAHVRRRRGLPECWQRIPRPRVHRRCGGILGSLTALLSSGPADLSNSGTSSCELSSSGGAVLQRLPNPTPYPKVGGLDIA